MPQTCPSCGKATLDTAKFCVVCGQPLSTKIPGKTKAFVLLDNRYEVLNVVKSGAMGSIYRARDNRLNNIVAIKKMFSCPGSQIEQEYSEKRFEAEAQILSSLHHSGLPKVFDYFQQNDPETNQPSHYLVMTFIEGSDFEAIIKRRNNVPFSVDEALAYFRQMLIILNYLHTQRPPIIYRDLNPRNIMLSSGNIVLVDFGIARIFQSEKKGTAIGTPGYASPEQYKGEGEPRSDLYSLGVVVHYFLTGKDPEESSQQIFTFQPIRQVNPSVPEYLENIIMSLLNIVPDQRPHSAQEVIKTLNIHKIPQHKPIPVDLPVEKPVPERPSKSSIETIWTHFDPGHDFLRLAPWAIIPMSFLLIIIMFVLFSPDKQESDTARNVSQTPSVQISNRVNNLEKTPDGRETPTTEFTPTSLKEQGEPVTCVELYYKSINAKDFPIAYELESERSRIKTSYNEWYQNIWSNNVSIILSKQALKTKNNLEAEVSVELISIDKIKTTGKEERAVYAGTVKLIHDSGKWWIDGFSLTTKTGS